MPRPARPPTRPWQDTRASSPGGERSSMQSRKLTALLALGAVAIAVVLFIVLSGGSGSNGDEASHTFRFELANGKAVGGVQEVSVMQGDHLTVTLQTDASAELHVHGYEVHERSSPALPDRSSSPPTRRAGSRSRPTALSTARSRAASSSPSCRSIREHPAGPCASDRQAGSPIPERSLPGAPPSS